jgi:hypothetical protein
MLWLRRVTPSGENGRKGGRGMSSVTYPRVGEAHDRVRVPDGRIGTVLGYYRRENETVLVEFAFGPASEFLRVDVETLSHE